MICQLKLYIDECDLNSMPDDCNLNFTLMTVIELLELFKNDGQIFGGSYIY